MCNNVSFDPWSGHCDRGDRWRVSTRLADHPRWAPTHHLERKASGLTLNCIGQRSSATNQRPSSRLGMLSKSTRHGFHPSCVKNEVAKKCCHSEAQHNRGTFVHLSLHALDRLVFRLQHEFRLPHGLRSNSYVLDQEIEPRRVCRKPIVVSSAAIGSVSRAALKLASASAGGIPFDEQGHPHMEPPANPARIMFWLWREDEP